MGKLIACLVLALAVAGPLLWLMDRVQDEKDERVKASEAVKLCRLAERRVQERDFIGAIPYITAALDLKPEARTYLFRSNCYRMVGLTYEAGADIEAAIKLEPGNRAAFKNRESLRRQLAMGGRDTGVRVESDREGESTP